MLLAELQAALLTPLPERDERGGGAYLLNELACYAQERLREKLDCARLAAAFNITPNYVSLGEGFSGYVSETRLELAAALLEESCIPPCGGGRALLFASRGIQPYNQRQMPAWLLRRHFRRDA